MSENDSERQRTSSIINLPLSEPLSAAENLQFQRAVPVVALPPNTKQCVACKRVITDAYFHAQGEIVCPACAERIQAGTQAPPVHSLMKAFLYGLGAAIAGSLLYSVITIVTHIGLGLIAIVIGFMVGKSIRYASKGMGGRPQQILAVTLTYFAMSAAYLTIGVYDYIQNHAKTDQVKTQQAAAGQSPQATQPPETQKAQASPFVALITLVGLSLAAPFLTLQSGIGGIIRLVIIFFALQRAWHLTGRPDILVMGPYQADAVAAQ